jgi:hypothetical protein
MRSRSAADAPSAAAASPRRNSLSCSPRVRSVALRPGLAARAERRLHDLDRCIECLERTLEPSRRGEQRLQRAGVGAADPQPRRDLGECGLGLDGGFLGDGSCTFRHLRLIAEQPRLLGQRAPARVELEQHRFRRLAREPQLATIRVVAVAVGRDRRNLRLQQLGLVDDGQPVDELAHVAADEHAQRAEPCRRRALEQRERRLRPVGDERRCARTERRGHRALRARLDAEQRQGQRFALLGERARRRGNPLPLRERVLEGREPLLRGESALGERVALVRRLARRGACVQRLPLELLGRRAAARRVGLCLRELRA